MKQEDEYHYEQEEMEDPDVQLIYEVFNNFNAIFSSSNALKV